MTLTEANSKRDTLNSILEQELDKQTDAWGIDVIRVELQRIEPPDDVQQAMNNVVIAERDKKAAIDFATATETKADGERRAEVKKAEGIKQALILEAEGRADAIKKVALAEADKIEKINTAVREFFKDEAQIYKKLETVENALKDGSKFVIDPNTEITTVIAEKMAGIIPIEKKPKEDNPVE
jgi:regulator of protease activity HflC (stomatin/prohibitin superfamily)